MPLTNGQTFAGYTIIRLLGSGGMGEVYLVQHPRLPRQEALKVLRPEFSRDASFRERFIREADLAAGLRHPHVVGIHDRGEHDGQLWIAMDYIEGTDAAQLMQQRYPAGMPVELAIPIITAVASALDYAHKKGLLHRDVKPANIIVTDSDADDRSVFLADFGIARPLDDISGITTTNMTVGTVAYAAPEQLMGEEMDGRVDQYALAATAYHMLTGLQLFPYSNPAVVISRHLNTTPPRLGDRRPDCAGLDDVLQIALAKHPSDRFPSCSAFAQALVDESPGPGGASAKATTQAAPRPRRSAPTSAAKSPAVLPPAGRRHAWVVAGSTLAVVLLVVAIALTWRPWDNPQSDSAGTTSTTAATALTTQNARPPSAPPPPPAPTTTAPSPPETTGAIFVPPVAPRKLDLTRAFSFVIPRAWAQADASHLDYGSARLTPVSPPEAASYTQIILGLLDDRLYANSESDVTMAAKRLASDMGEFFMANPGRRINQQLIPLEAGSLSGAASYYEVQYNDTTLPDGQMWAAVISGREQRYYVMWLGNREYPVDMDAAKAVAQSIRPA